MKCEKCGEILQNGGSKAQYDGRLSNNVPKIKIPVSVKNVALKSYKMKSSGFCGGQSTGWKRAKQLSTKEYISIKDLQYMRNWYARHYHTSYPSYQDWEKAGKPMDDPKFHKRCGIIAWQIWGGTPALRWVNSKIRMLNDYYDKDYKKIGV